MKYLVALLFIISSFSLIAAETAGCEKSPNCTTTNYGVADEIILAYPEPDVDTLTVDQKLLHDRSYNQVDGRMDVYDAPGGNLIRSLDAGFNFMTTINRVDGWVEINPGEWVKAEQLKNINHVVSNFTGALLPEEGLKYPMAWVLVNLYPATEPGGTPNETENDLIYRYTRVNIYTSVELDGWRWYQIGINKWVHQTQIAKVIPVTRPAKVNTHLWISVDLYEQVLMVYRGNKPIFATLIASGLPRWPTREGIFNITWRRTRDDMTWGTPGDDFYYLEEVPWTMFFDEGRALHGAYWHDGFGYRRSHGCVNMSITDAHWLFNQVAEYMGSRASAKLETGPSVYVYSSGTYVQ